MKILRVYEYLDCLKINTHNIRECVLCGVCLFTQCIHYIYTLCAYWSELKYLYIYIVVLFAYNISPGECIPPKTVSLAAATFRLLVTIANLDLVVFQVSKINWIYLVFLYVVYNLI